MRRSLMDQEEEDTESEDGHSTSGESMQYRHQISKMQMFQKYIPDNTEIIAECLNGGVWRFEKPGRA